MYEVAAEFLKEPPAVNVTVALSATVTFPTSLPVEAYVPMLLALK
jgi:hypothetical protein